MDTLDKCFVTELVEPLKLIDVAPANGPNQQPLTRSRQFFNIEDLTDYFNFKGNDGYSCRYISICQRNSWRPLQVTRRMLDLIVSKNNIGSSLWDLSSCFYGRNLEVEEAFCGPYSQSRNGPWIETSYSIRYPEFKKGDDQWAIRQSGIYHRFNTDTKQCLFILFSPTPSSKAHQAAEQFLSNPSERQNSPFWLHELLFSAYLQSWRQYMAAEERKYLPIANSTFSTYIDEPLRLGYDNLSTLVSLETHFVRSLACLASTGDVLDELLTLLSENSIMFAPGQSDENIIQIKNLKRRCIAYSRTATYLQERIQTTAHLLADTLSFRDQVIAKEQTGNMLQLNKSAVFITTLTLVYLPSSFVATFFGMNFFDMDQQESRIVGTSMIWIFVVSATALTGITFLFYYWLLQHDGVLFRRLAPKVRITADWKTLTRRFTKTNAPGVELRSLSV